MKLPETLFDSEGKQFTAGVFLCTREYSSNRVLCTKVSMGVGTFEDKRGKVFNLIQSNLTLSKWVVADDQG
jgi:hypothetical protein